ncbi:hypothetical protein B0T18DRAFT_335399 [Schizothecium vesticola]|uniref:Peroxin 11C n=1 Tax=Schizothecium vesticola TaxID=314040 RepID=A0AA40BQE8_9PEZI|nr:hypothetical protein B0T18DRAFT_335399 [Schizothecium vesticola]
MPSATASVPEPGPTPAPIASLPSGAPIPTAAPPSKPIPVGALLAALPSRADAVLTRLHKCLATPAGIDTVMLFVCYTSRLSASALTGLSASPAGKWLALVLSTRASATLAARLRALSTLLSEARTILRLWALLGMYTWGKGLVGKTLRGSPEGEKESKTTMVIEWARLLCCVGLQGLENGAYLSSRGVLGWTPAQQGLAYKWSARFWAAYIGIELGRLLAGSTEETGEWRKKVARNAAWMPLTLHWSTDVGFVSEPVIGALASVPGIIQMRDLWASTK